MTYKDKKLAELTTTQWRGARLTQRERAKRDKEFRSIKAIDKPSKTSKRRAARKEAQVTDAS